MKKRIITAIVILGVLLVLMGVLLLTQNSNVSNSQVSTAATTNHSISITEYMFSPSQLIIKVGDTVVWTNNGATSHTVTSDSGSELSSPTLSSNGIYAHTFNAAGTYNYHCSIHPTMTGVIIVQ
jgi:amicyanin